MHPIILHTMRRSWKRKAHFCRHRRHHRCQTPCNHHHHQNLSRIYNLHHLHHCNHLWHHRRHLHRRTTTPRDATAISECAGQAAPKSSAWTRMTACYGHPSIPSSHPMYITVQLPSMRCRSLCRQPDLAQSISARSSLRPLFLHQAPHRHRDYQALRQAHRLLRHRHQPSH